MTELTEFQKHLLAWKHLQANIDLNLSDRERSALREIIMLSLFPRPIAVEERDVA